MSRRLAYFLALVLFGTVASSAAAQEVLRPARIQARASRKQPSRMVDVGCTVYQLLYFVQTPAALGVAEQARAGDVVSGEGFPVNPAEFAALEEVKFRVEDDVYQHFLHLRDGDAFEAVQRGFGGESMQDDAAGEKPVLGVFQETAVGAPLALGVDAVAVVDEDLHS